uniref:Protein translocase subunit SecA n=1 Tax=Thermosporothrix sp. COM3 TaxID=2490863 RepID=A0A455SP52_9CHLR|nr:protein translocase subunit SecA [Thermosporothrix sp. COM3]
MQLLSKLLGDPNKREIKSIQPIIDKINALEPELKKLSDEELAGKTAEFRSRLSLHLKGGLVLEDELVQLFREALDKVEPLARKCTDDQLRAAITEYRQKIDRKKDAETELKDHLQDLLSEGFEEAYTKLSPILNELRVSAAMDLAEERQEWPDEASDPKKTTFALLTEVEPLLKDIDEDERNAAFETAWTAYEKTRSSGQITDENADRYMELFFLTILNHMQEELIALKAEEMDALLPDMVKRYRTGETLDDLLPEAFAVVRETGRRVINMRHYDVQLIGGYVLHQGKIAEMRTGEGKTLVATAPVYLNALTGKGVHVVTVNDYLARRDAEWMGNIYRFLGLTVGILVNAIEPYTPERKAAYQADITYGTNNEFGFDYLRDNMATSLEQTVQRELNFAIVDEVDNILIDEARTPLIISGPGEEPTEMYAQFARWAPRLKEELDYTVDEKHRAVMLTEAGIDKIEKMAGIDNIYAEENLDMTRYMENALKAEILYKRDRDYIVKDGEVVIVDEFTGRQMPGRRYSEGLHQAIEAKEGVKVQRENHTLATITFQNYFRLYNKLAGMTGTALTEAEEFHKIYSLDVIVIPTNKPMIRRDMPDLIFRNQEAKYRAIVNEIKERHEEGQPVLVGTTSVEISEMLSAMLEREGIEHNVLNAKHHEREAHIVAQAGRSGAVTIATNMAGRGTDILLGGNPEGYFDTILRKHAESVSFIRDMPTRSEEEREEKEEAIRDYIANMSEEEKQELFQQKIKECEEDRKRVIELGGLYIIGTERHESRRIDNQLRGRAGRQGDPGESRFFLALDDELMRRFAADRVSGLMEKAGMEDIPLESKIFTRFIENAQRQVEGYNFDLRKHVVEYDDVIAQQRAVIYADRRTILEHGDMHDRIVHMIENEVAQLVEAHIPGHAISDEEELDSLFKALETWVELPEEIVPDNIHALQKDKLKKELIELVVNHYEQRAQELRTQAKAQGLTIDPIRELERTNLLRIVDRLWMDHIDALDLMRAGIGLRSVGQRDPLVEFKNEAYMMFEELKRAIQRHTVDNLLKLLRNEVTIQVNRPEPPRRIPRNVQTNAEAIAEASGQAKSDETKQPVKTRSNSHRQNGQRTPAPAARSLPKVGRNDPCPCGSGKKYKRCHGA